MSDLHSSLKTDIVGRAEAHGTDWALARLQHGKDHVTFSLHANPRTFSTAGVQLTDTLSLLGFRRSSCAFFHGQCYVRAVDGSLELEQFAQAFPQIHDAVKQADGHLAACGIVLERPEGVGYFFGKSSGGRRRQDRPSGDGHTSPKTTRMGEADDDHFRYAFTWVEGGADKGWTTHYRPKHPPLSPEMESAFRHLGLHSFASCPEFDFDPCHWRFLAYEQRGTRSSRATPTTRTARSGPTPSSSRRAFSSC